MVRQGKAVWGFCQSRAHAEEAIDKLRLCGFRNTDVSSSFDGKRKSVSGVLTWPAGPDISSADLKQYRDWMDGGGVVLLVHCADSDWERRAERVLNRLAAAGG